jgi:isocitrate lyase
MELAIERGRRYLDSGIPDLLWCELPSSAREPVETFAREIRRRFPQAKLAFNWSSSFKWHLDPDPLRFDELGKLGYRFIFITLAAIHANGLGFARLLQDLRAQGALGYVELQRHEWAEGLDLPSRSHHLFSGVPYHHAMGQVYGAERLSRDVHDELREAAAV